jgi:hypothetical protein
MSRLLLAALTLHSAAGLTVAPAHSSFAARAGSVRASAVAEKPAVVEQERVASRPRSSAEHLAMIRAEGEAAILARRIRALTLEGRAAQKERAFKAKLYSLKREGRAAIAERAEKSCTVKTPGGKELQGKDPMASRVAQYFAEMTRRAQMTKLLSLRIEGKAAIKARKLMALAYEGLKAITERARKASLFEQMRKRRTEAGEPAAPTPRAAAVRPTPREPSSSPSADKPLSLGGTPPAGFEWGGMY